MGEYRKIGFSLEERLVKYLGIKPGLVTPLALIYLGAKNISLIIDKDILVSEYIHFHPFRNTASLKIGRDDFLKFCDEYTCKTLFYDTEK